MNLRVRKYSRGVQACSPEKDLIPRSSVVCFGVFSATVSVNYYTSISLDGFKGLKLFKSRRRTPIISNQRVLTKIKENELKNSKIHALIYINPLCVRVCKD